MFVGVFLRWHCSNGNRVSSYGGGGGRGSELFFFFLPSSCFLNIMCIKVQKYKKLSVRNLSHSMKIDCR
jgi:hypothetical protein